MQIYFDARWIGPHGIGRFAREVRKGLGENIEIKHTRKPSSPFDALFLAGALRNSSSKSLFFSPGYNSPILTNIPFIFTIHDLTHIASPEIRTGANVLYYSTVVKLACRRAQTILTVSEFSRTQICDWSGVSSDKVVNVGNGVDGCFKIVGSVAARTLPYILVIGNRRAHKNEVRMLRAFAAIAKRIPHRVAFIGEANAELCREARSAELESRVVFLGSLSDEELAATYRGADAVMFVSLYEGFGLPIVEAQACGIPVITSNVTSMPEIAGSGALTVNPRDIDEIANALERVLSDVTLRKRLIDSGLKNSSLYTWQRTIDRVHEIVSKAKVSLLN